MNISYNWIKDFINTDLDANQVAEVLTSIGLETGSVDEVQTIKGGLEGLVIGKVLTCEDHPNSDHLHITTVDLGENEPSQIVCGASNVAAGQKVVVATLGTTLYSGDESFMIKKSKIRGVESFGMICAEDEIGLGDSHEGIMVLPDSAVIGTKAKDYFGIKSDFVLEVDITPNRVDAASHFGVARDLAASLLQQGHSVTLTKPSIDAFIEGADSSITVEIANSEAAPRYSGVTIRGVQVKESPQWLQDRLNLIGIRPINNIVDVTNYVLHETGHPLHCFDTKFIQGNKIVVRTCDEGTKFVTLDEKERELSSSDLMICNAVEPMCLAGVFGGLHSGVTEETVDVFLESAYFNPTWVRKSARRHQLNTDSSFRFERGCDPNATVYVLKRAALLIQEVAGGSIGKIQDLYPQAIKPFEVELSLSKVNRVIGKDISKETVLSILSNLEIDIVSEAGDLMTLAVPTYRVDVQRDVDVIEEILRIYGYNNVEIPEQVNATLSYKKETDVNYALQNTVSEQLIGAGFSEILNNSLTKESYYKESTSLSVDSCVRIINPLGVDLSVMRQSLLFGGLESIAYNKNRKRGDIRFFEFGNTYFFDVAKVREENCLSAYSEEMHLGLWMSGNTVADSWGHPQEKSTIYHIKGAVESIFARLGVDMSKVMTESFSDDLFSNGLRYLLPNGKSIGQIAVLSKQLQKRFDIDTAVYYGDIHWDALLKSVKKLKVQYQEISKFPSVKRDLALLIDSSITFDQIKKVAIKVEKKLLKDLFLFDVYEGKNLEAGKKSYAVSFILSDNDKTLTDKQIDSSMERIRITLEKELGAKLR